MLIKKKYRSRIKDEEIVRHIVESGFPVLNNKGEFEYVQCKTIVYGDDEFDEIIESINNDPDLWR